MLDNLRRQRGKYGLHNYLKRTAAKELSKLFYRVDGEGIARALHGIGLEPGAVVCVHSALSRLGYVTGGGNTVIDAILQAVGPSGTLLMPAFSTGGSMASYIERGEIFDVNATPSKVGAITELFRNRPGVLRSLHPTNSLTGYGANAADLLADHDKSETPYGRSTPYGRLAERDDSFILMLETHIHSLLHHLQERVDFPHLFLPGHVKVPLIDAAGKHRYMHTRVMRPRAPYFIAVPSADETRPDWAILHDFALIFPAHRVAEMATRGVLLDGYRPIHERRAKLEADGILRTARLGRGEIGLLSVRRFLAVVEPELRELIERFREHYQPDRMKTFEYF